MTTITPERYVEIHELADDLIASCDGGLSHQDELNALTLDECRLLETFAFECTHCNQWYDIHEDDGGQFVCGDCKDD